MCLCVCVCVCACMCVTACQPLSRQVLLELMMEVHVTIEARDVRAALLRTSGDPSKPQGPQGGDKDIDRDITMNQVFFEVEVNNSDVVFLENFSCRLQHWGIS